MKMRKSLFLLGLSGIVLLSGCAWLRGPVEPDVVLWKSADIPQAWIERQIVAVAMQTGVVTNEVGVAAQFNETDRGQAYQGHESFLVAAAYNKRTGAFSAEWGYAPKPDYGHNGVKLQFNPAETNLTAVGISLGKHPVAYELSLDFSTCTMLWGPRFENRGQAAHRVTWTSVKDKQ